MVKGTNPREPLAHTVWSAPPEAPAPPSSSAGEGVEWRRYVEAVRRRLWLVIGLFVVGGVVATLVTLRQPKLYQAAATIVIETTTPKVLTGVEEVVDVATSGWVPPQFYETEYEIMKSRAVARRAAEKLGLINDDKRNGLKGIDDPEARERARAALDPSDLVVGRYAVLPDKKSSLVNIQVVDTDPAFTAALANAAAEAYVELNLEKRVYGTKDASTWLAVQHQDLKRKLEATEDALYKFMEDNDVLNASLESQLEEVNQRLSAFNANLASVQAERIKSQLDAEALKNARTDPVLLDSLPEIQGASVLNTLKTKLIDLRELRNELAARYQEAHPKMKAIDEQLAILEAQRERDIDAILTGLERRQQSLETTEKGLAAAIRAEREREARLNRLTLDYERLKREVDTNAKLYDMVTSRMKEADITSALPFNNVRILDTARVPLAPFKPSLPTNLAAGLLLGLLLGIALALGIELLDTTVKTQEDVEKILGVPFLGLLPVIEAAKVGDPLEATRERDLYVLQDPKSSTAECARFIRTNLIFMSPDKPLRTMVVTSPAPEEGKTTTAVSIAITMAQAGSKTLLVDTDMRRPRLHRVFGVSNDAGVSSVVVGESKLDAAVHRTAAPNLDVLPCGPVPPNPAELLHTEKFRDLVNELLKRYDRVVFDTPPVGAVTDPAVLGAQADGILLVVKCERTSKESARQALRVLQDANARVLGAVLNDVDLAEQRYGHAYYAYYRGYHYGEKDTKEAPPNAA